MPKNKNVMISLVIFLVDICSAFTGLRAVEAGYDKLLDRGIRMNKFRWIRVLLYNWSFLKLATLISRM